MASLGEIMVEVGADLDDFQRSMQQVERDMQRVSRNLSRNAENMTDSYADAFGNLDGYAQRSTSTFNEMNRQFRRNTQLSARELETLPEHMRGFYTEMQSGAREVRAASQDIGGSLEEMRDHVLATRTTWDKATKVSGTGKEAIATIQAMGEEAKKTRLALLGMNADGSKPISQAESVAQMENYKRSLQAARQDLERFKAAGDMGSYVAGMQQLELQMKQVEQSMRAAARGGDAYLNEVRQLGIITESEGNRAAVAMEGMRDSFLQANERMQATATQSSKVIGNLARMDMRGLDQQFLRLADSLERKAKAGTAANLAIRELGPTASMKELQDQVNLINAGLARSQQLAMYSAIAFGMLTVGLVSFVKDFDQVSQAWERFTSTWMQALDPFLQSFANVIAGILNFLSYIGELVIKLNELNPAIVTCAGWFLFLTAALLPLLAPLAIGISSAGSFAAAFTALWAVIGQVTIAFLTVIGTVMAVAAAIVGAVYAVTRMWQESSLLRDTVVEVWNTIWNTIVTACAPIMAAWEQLKVAFAGMVAAFTGGTTEMSSIWQLLGDALARIINFVVEVSLPLFKAAWEILAMAITAIIQVLTKAFDLIRQWWEANGPAVTAMVEKMLGYIKSGFKEVSSFLESIMPQIKSIVEDAWKLIQQIIAFAMKYIVPVVKQGWQVVKSVFDAVFPILKSIVQDTWENIKNIIKSALKIIEGFIKLFSSILEGDWQGAWDAVKQIASNAMSLLWNLIQVWVIGKILKIFSSFGKSVVETVSKAFNSLLDKALAPLKKLWDKCKEIVDKIVNAFKSMKISIPKFKIPSIGVQVKWGGPGNAIPYPSFDVKWHAKGGIFNAATMLGGGNGVGEAGNEAVLPIQHKRYMKPFTNAVAANLADMKPDTPQQGVTNHFTISEMVVREEADIDRIADALARKQRYSERAAGTYSFA
ncbi:phage tail protein [Bacillus wiedmannii]|uniref:phage tail protein n=1 Tax=Bacillus wiedmannii TaxID=1890302 RepID=UPI000BF01CED|nr:hypothetical protein [Bacillus wiedmannii]PEM08509.1 hypothetical protein CN610_19850 [Bacillus wiedmannii]